MLICVDIGNTNIVLGVFENEKIKHSFRLQTDIYQTVDEYGIKILQMFNSFEIKKNDIEGVIIASVVPQLDMVFIKLFEKYFNKESIFVGPGIKSGINIRLDNPKQLGADILVGAVGAIEKYSSPTIVIDMGTAITFCYVNSNKELLGGIIIPGIKTSFNALFKKTSKLEEVGIEKPKSVVGRDTISSLQSGMVYGMASTIDGLIRKIKKENGEANVVITGGEARFIINVLEEKVIYDENLLLDGLRLLYYKNKK